MRHAFATIAFAVASTVFVAPAMAVSVDLGNLSAVSPVSSTRSFDVLFDGAFTDYYTFSIDSLSNVSGTTAEQDGYLAVSLGWVFKVKDLDISTLSLSKLTSGGTYSTIVADSSPESFSFAALTGGDYRLTVNGSITPMFSYSSTGSANDAAASYTLTASSSTIAAPVPEASDLALTAIGLAGVAFWSRRRRQA
jgi:hypothetical protein